MVLDWISSRATALVIMLLTVVASVLPMPERSSVANNAPPEASLVVPSSIGRSGVSESGATSPVAATRAPVPEPMPSGLIAWAWVASNSAPESGAGTVP